MRSRDEQDACQHIAHTCDIWTHMKVPKDQYSRVPYTNHGMYKRRIVAVANDVWHNVGSNRYGGGDRTDAYLLQYVVRRVGYEP